MNKFGLVSVGVVAAASALGAAAPALSKEVVLRAANCFPVGSPPGKPFDRFVTLLNEKGKGVITAKVLGGAPAIGSPFTMTRRMARGAYDIIGCPDAYYGNVIPEAAAVRLMPFTATEARKNGAWAYFDKLLNAKGVKLLGQTHNFGPFYLFLSRPIAQPDLTGLHLRVAPVYTPFFKSLGATTQRSNFAQVYTYMENGTVVGFGWPALGWNPSWAKVAKYWVEPGFYRAGIQTMMNLEKWNSLTTRQKNTLMAVVLEHEATTEKWPERLDKQKEWMKSKGMKPVVFDKAGTAKWSKAALDAGWADLVKKSPKHGVALRKMFEKASN